MSLFTYSEKADIEKIYHLYKRLPRGLKSVMISALYVLNKTFSRKRACYPLAATFYLTWRCNARCGHCFVCKKLDSGADELTLSEIKTLFFSLRQTLSRLAYAGGEPFLREDIVDISRIVSQSNRVKKIWSGTNGIDSARIYALSEQILKNIRIPFVVTVSIEGLEATHDTTLGIEGAFKNAVQTIRLLKKLSEKYSHFKIEVLITISNKNRKELIPLINFIQRELGVYPLTQFLWGSRSTCFALDDDAVADFNPPNPDFYLPPIEELKVINEEINDAIRERSLLFKIESTRRKYLIEIIKRRKRLFPCCASQGNNAIIYPDGEVSLCEFSRIIGNVRDHSYDFSALYHSEKAQILMKKTTLCACTLPYIFTSSMIDDVKILKEILL